MKVLPVDHLCIPRKAHFETAEKRRSLFQPENHYYSGGHFGLGPKHLYSMQVILLSLQSAYQITYKTMKL